MDYYVIHTILHQECSRPVRVLVPKYSTVGRAGRYEYGVDRGRTPVLGLELTIRPVATVDANHRNVRTLTWEH